MDETVDGPPALHEHALAHAVDRLHSELEGTFGTPTIEQVLHDSYRRLRQGARIDDFVPVLAERFARERLYAIAKVQGLGYGDTCTVLFLCVHNAGRSQMAAGWMQHLAGDGVTVLSGGSAPAAAVHPVAVAAMREVGIDISNSFPKPWTDESVEAADVVVTMGCGDACPVLPGRRYLDWDLADPEGRPLAEVRAIRDDIRGRIESLLSELGAASAAG